MKPMMILLAMVSALAAGPASAADISGYHEEPKKEFGKDANYKLVGDAKFGWRTGTVRSRP